MSGALTYGYPQPIAEYKTAGDEWEVSGYASTWDLDLGGDVVHRGAFLDSLRSGAKVKFLYAHDPSQLVGKPVELREDDRGLFGRFAVSRTRLGHDVHQLLVDGCLDSFSIGFLAKEHDFDEKARVRNLRKVELLECSLVALPMNPRATVTGVKAADYASLPLEDVLEAYEEHRTAALGQAKAVAERRLAEGRKLSDRTLATLERLRTLAAADAADLLRLATTPPPPAATPAATPTPDAPAPAEAASLVEAHLRRARLKELCRAYGVTTP